MPPVAVAVPGFDVPSWNALFAPAGTPQPVVRKLNEEFVRAMKAPDVTKRFTDQGLDVVTNTPEAFAALHRDEPNDVSVAHLIAAPDLRCLLGGLVLRFSIGVARVPKDVVSAAQTFPRDAMRRVVMQFG